MTQIDQMSFICLRAHLSEDECFVTQYRGVVHTQQALRRELLYFFFTNNDDLFSNSSGGERHRIVPLAAEVYIPCQDLQHLF